MPQGGFAEGRVFEKRLDGATQVGCVHAGLPEQVAQYGLHGPAGQASCDQVVMQLRKQQCILLQLINGSRRAMQGQPAMPYRHKGGP